MPSNRRGATLRVSTAMGYLQRLHQLDAVEFCRTVSGRGGERGCLLTAFRSDARRPPDSPVGLGPGAGHIVDAVLLHVQRRV